MRQRKPAFFSFPALLALAALILVALYLLFPRQAIYEDPRYLESPDSISLAYLDTLLKSDPGNQPLRLNLSRMLQKVGEHAKAMSTLAPLLDNTDVPLQAMATQTELLRGEFFRAKTKPARSNVRDKLVTTLEQALGQSYSIAQKQALMADILPLLAPDERLAARKQLFELATGTDRLRLGQDLARQQEALGNPNDAKTILEKVLPLVPQDQQAAFTRNLIRLDLATGNPKTALARFQALHKDRKLNTQELREGMRLADLAGQPGVGAPWLTLLAQAEPENMDVQRRLLQQQLGQGNISEALITAQGMEDNGRGSLARTDKERIARLYEWNNQPSEALRYWRDLFLNQPPGDTSSLAYDRATNLAAGLFRWPTLTELLQVQAERKQLPAQGYNQLANALISTGKLNAADRYLTEGISRFPENASLRQRRLTLLINSRRFNEAIDLLQAASRLSDEEKVQLANLHWRTRDPESALATLDFTPQDPALAQEVEAMRLDLARILNQNDLLERYYERMSALPHDQVSAELRDQMIELSWQFGSPEETLAWSRQQYQESGELRHLLIMAELQSSLGLQDELAGSLADWDRHFSQAGNDPTFWILTAQLHQYRNDPEAAQLAFLAAARLAPDNNRLLTSWGWFLLSQPDLLPGRLPQILSMLADSPSTDTHVLQVYGNLALDKPGQADTWFKAARAQLTNDAGQLLALSDYAQNYGVRTEAEAEALRKQAVFAASKHKNLDPELDAKLRGILNDPAQEPFEPLYRSENRALQASFQLRDLGGFSLHTTGLTGQFSHDRYRWLFAVEQTESHDRGLLNTRPAPGTGGRLQWQSNYYDYLVSAELSTYTLASGEQQAAELELTKQPSDGFTMGASLAFNERVTDSAEAWWLASADRVSVSASYTPWQRLEIAGKVDYRAIDEAFGGQIGKGYNANLFATYSVFRNDPAWRVSLNYQSQQLSLSDRLQPQTLAKLSLPLSPEGLLADDYRRVGFTSEWSHGELHALYRTSPSPRFFFALDSGYVLSTSSFDFGARMGLGWRIAGDDELAFSAGYSTDSLDGQSRADAKLTYTLYLGH